MNKPLAMFVVLGSLLGLASASHAEYPKPSIYPISWEFKFEHGAPKRIAVAVPDSSVPKAYWYIAYTVTNETDQERTFLPVFEILTEDGRIIRSDKNIPQKVFETIKVREGNKLLLNFPRVEGDLRIGPDQARDGVAIWEEPTPRMGTFSIFIQGLSGESTTVQGPDKKDLILRKTLQLDYQIRGDEVYPSKNEVAPSPETWVMR